MTVWRLTQCHGRADPADTFLIRITTTLLGNYDIISNLATIGNLATLCKRIHSPPCLVSCLKGLRLLFTYNNT
jgi:hypothetical protein